MRTHHLAAIGGFVFNALLAVPLSASSDYGQWLEEAWSADGPGAAALLIKDGDVLFRSASGMADVELGVPLTADHVFRIGSISKQFTAAAILLLEDQGKLSVKDDVTAFLPDYPTHGHEIRIEHLLSHTSGISNYTSIPGYIDDGAIRKDLATEELIEVFANLPMDFAPGEAFRYSNSGYVLLGAIIEKVTGQSYADFMQTAIFDRLGLDQTRHGGPEIIPGRAKGYQGAAGEYRNADFISMTQPHGAGALVSTVDDLAKWTQALFGGELLSQEALDKMISDFELNNGEQTGYGFGLGVRQRFGEREIAHGGGIHGFSTSGTWLPDHEIYAVVLSNNQGSRATGFLAARMAFDAAGADYPRFTAIEVDPERLADYQGVYRLGEEASRTVVMEVEAGRLYAQPSGAARSEIVAASPDRFFFPGSFSYVNFIRDPGGRVTAMEMHQGGATEAERAERISDEVAVEETANPVE